MYYFIFNLLRTTSSVRRSEKQLVVLSVFCNSLEGKNWQFYFLRRKFFFACKGFRLITAIEQWQRWRLKFCRPSGWRLSDAASSFLFILKNISSLKIRAKIPKKFISLMTLWQLFLIIKYNISFRGTGFLNIHVTTFLRTTFVKNSKLLLKIILLISKSPWCLKFIYEKAWL